MKTMIIGVGDDYYSDDAIGLILIRKLKEEFSEQSSLSIVESGKQSFQIIDYLDDFNPILIIDAVKMGLKSGVPRLFKFNEIKANIIKEHISYHQMGVAENILLAETLGKNVDNITIYGVQPEILKYGNKLSKELEKNIDKYVEEIKEFILSVSMKKKSSYFPGMG